MNKRFDGEDAQMGLAITCGKVSVHMHMEDMQMQVFWEVEFSDQMVLNIETENKVKCRELPTISQNYKVW